MKWIPEREYRRIERIMPIACVDLIIRRGSGVLLVKRACEPFRGKWWVPGGRLMRGERVSAAIRRIARQEVGLMVHGQPSGFYEGFYKNRHSISIVCECEDYGGEVHLDSQSDSFKWSVLPKQLQ